MTVPARVLNELFSNKLGSSEGKEKMAEYGGSYIRDRLREVSYARISFLPSRSHGPTASARSTTTPS